MLLASWLLFNEASTPLRLMRIVLVYAGVFLVARG